MSKVTITHFIPLIGAFRMAADLLAEEHDVENKYAVSFDAFANNEQHLYHNYPDLQRHLLDETMCTGTDPDINVYKQFVKENGIEPTTLNCAVPPCAGLSMLNRDNRGTDAFQNNWMFEAVKFFIAQNSECLVVENAPGLVGKAGLGVIRKLRTLLDAHGGYRLRLTKTTTLNHGLPQNRSRSFFYVYKDDSPTYRLFANLERKTPPIEEFLSRPREEDPSVQHYVLPANWATKWVDMMKDTGLFEGFQRYFDASGKKFMCSLPYLIDLYKDDSSIAKDHPQVERVILHAINKKSQGKNYWDESPALIREKANSIITKNIFKMLHPVYRDRLMTVRELMDLMGYPERFVLIEPQKNWNHICQSVPVLTAADHMRWALGLAGVDDRYMANMYVETNDVLLQDNTHADLERELYHLGGDYSEFVRIKKREVIKS